MRVIMKFLFLPLLVALGNVIPAFTQPTMDFDQTTFDFGEITEGDIASHEFIFTNTGNQPLVLSSVKASCGCTTPSWTKEPILPGKKGHIKASYNSKNRPGGFHKSITVTSNAVPATKVVYIKGTSVRKTALEPLFDKEALEQAPSIVLKQQHLQLGKVQMGSSHPMDLVVYNQGKSLLEIKGIYSTCKCIGIMPDSPMEVRAGSSINLSLVFTPKRLGENTYGAQVLSNDLIQPKHQIYFTSEVTPTPDASSVVKESPSKITF